MDFETISSSDQQPECAGNAAMQRTKRSKEVEKPCTVKYRVGDYAHSSRSTKTRGSSDHDGHSHDGHSHKSCGRSQTKSTVDARSCGRTPCKAADEAGPKKSAAMSDTERSAHCYPRRPPKERVACAKPVTWQAGQYVTDDCGSGIVPLRLNFLRNRKHWCKTPLSMYQATIGELGRKILCREEVIQRDLKPAPPCNIEEFILPPCRGYYRKRECVRPCEDQHSYVQRGQRHYRDRVERYWQPCMDKSEQLHLNVNEFAPHNVVLGRKMRRTYGNVDIPCW